MNELAPGTILGDYSVVRLLGQGGMGAVYLARQLSLDRNVALKFLPVELYGNPDYLERFVREARAAARLNHPNIIQVYDSGECDGLYFFVMEYAEGKDLADVVGLMGPMEEGQALQLIGQAAKALAYAHQMGIVHRDIKPENLLLTNNGILKVADLGLAKWKSSPTDLTLTSEGRIMGSPYYISPEQIKASKNIDGQTDIYSLGMTLYFLLTGRPPFSGDSEAEVMAQHLAENPPPIIEFNPKISRFTRDLVDHMTAKERKNRIQDMATVEARTASILNGEIARQVPSVKGTPTVKSNQQRVTVANAAMMVWGVLIFLGVSLGLYLVLRGKSQPPVSAPIETTQTTAETNPTPSSGEGQSGTAPISRNESTIIYDQPEYFQTLTIYSKANVHLNSDSLDQLDEKGRQVLNTCPSLTVGRWTRTDEWRGLIRFALERERGSRDLFQKLQNCTSAILELPAPSVPWDQGPKRTEFSYIQFGVHRVLKSWGNGLASAITPSPRSQQNPLTFNPGSWNTLSFEQKVRFQQAIVKETNWEFASVQKNIPWSTPGAKWNGVDYRELVASADDPTQTSFRIERSQPRPIRLNVLPDLQRIVRQLANLKTTDDCGWILMPTDGSLVVHFDCFETNPKIGPRLILTYPN